MSWQERVKVFLDGHLADEDMQTYTLRSAREACRTALEWTPEDLLANQDELTAILTALVLEKCGASSLVPFLTQALADGVEDGSAKQRIYLVTLSRILAGTLQNQSQRRKIMTTREHASFFLNARVVWVIVVVEGGSEVAAEEICKGPRASRVQRGRLPLLCFHGHTAQL